MTLKKVKVRVPATTSNLGPGFDALGMAFNLYNELELTIKKNSRRTLTIQLDGEGKEILPRDKSNIAYQAADKILRMFGVRGGEMNIRLNNSIPVSRGLGSSSTAIVGGLLAANILCGSRLDQQELINIATEIEGHPDNVVPAIAGGLCISCIEGKEVKYVKLTPPNDIKFLFCIPEFEVLTSKARKMLPKQVSFSDAVFNIQRSALLLAALSEKKYDMLAFATEDKLHQPYRKKLIPGYDDVFKTALAMGAYGVYLSGSGPSIGVISDNNAAKNNKIGGKLCGIYSKLKIPCRYKILTSDMTGASQLKSS